MSELQNCPCCGEKANIIITSEAGVPSGDKGAKVVISCQNRECGCKIEKWALKMEWAVESATKTWNNRVKERELTEEPGNTKCPVFQQISLERLEAYKRGEITEEELLMGEPNSRTEHTHI